MFLFKEWSLITGGGGGGYKTGGELSEVLAHKKGRRKHF